MFILPWIYPPNPGCQSPSNIMTCFTQDRNRESETILGCWDRSQPFNQTHTPSQLIAGTPKLVVWRCFSFPREYVQIQNASFRRGGGCIPSYTILPHPAAWKNRNMASSKRVSRPASTFPTSFPAQGNGAFFMWPTKREQESKPGRYQTRCFVVYVFFNIPIWGIYMWES